MNIRLLIAGGLLAWITGSTFAQKPANLYDSGAARPAGYLCCNMRSSGKWISDINYVEADQSIVRVGTPIKVTGYGRQRVLVQIDGKEQALGNDYSRDLGLEAFARRYVVAADPAIKLATYPAPLREAILAGHIRRGMTREQVLMAVGYPIASENPRLDAPRWRYWQSTFVEYQVYWGDDGRVKEVEGDPSARRSVFEE